MMLRSFLRFFRYAIKKLIGLFAMVIASVYLIILIANYGGYLDRIKKGLILEQIGGMVYAGWLEDTPEPERTRIIDERLMEE